MAEAQKCKPNPANAFYAFDHVTPTNSNGQSMSRPNTKSRGREIFSASLGVEGNSHLRKDLDTKAGQRSGAINAIYYTHPN